MMNRVIQFLLFLLALKASMLSAQAGITGRLVLDSSLWAPVAYLSHIPELGQMNTISYKQIIAQSELGPDGNFTFSTELLPVADQLYRIHVVKKGDPPATLMIGGKEHNHFFLLARRGSQLVFEMDPGKTLFNDLTMEGYGPNRSLMEIDGVIGRLNAVDQVASSINRDFTREVICDQLRAMADSSRHPLVSLYALHASNYKEHYLENPAYYRHYLRKWRHEETEYYSAFRHQLDSGRSSLHPAIIGGGALFLLLVLLAGFYFRRNMQQPASPYADLTVQERKVFDLLKEGRSNKEIAEEFSVSVSTVKSHVNSIFSKLGVKSRREIMDI